MELEEFFNKISLPKKPVQLDSSGTITNFQKFINNNMKVVKFNNGKEIYKPYFDRLTELKKYLQKNN